MSSRHVPSASRDLVAEWHSSVEAHVTNGMSRTEAIKAVDRQRPGLREAMIQQHNRAR